MNFRRFVILIVAAVIFGGPASSMIFTPAAKQALKFTVYRDDAPIGYHNFSFRPRGETLKVDIDVDLDEDDVRDGFQFVTSRRNMGKWSVAEYEK